MQPCTVPFQMRIDNCFRLSCKFRLWIQFKKLKAYRLKFFVQRNFFFRLCYKYRKLCNDDDGFMFAINCFHVPIYFNLAESRVEKTCLLGQSVNKSLMSVLPNFHFFHGELFHIGDWINLNIFQNFHIVLTAFQARNELEQREQLLKLPQSSGMPWFQSKVYAHWIESENL